MRKEDWLNLGSISKTHGFKGEVILLLAGKTSEDFDKLESVFLEINGQLVPFFIEAFKISGGSTIIIKFNDIHTEEKARQLVKSKVFISSSFLPEDQKDRFDPFALTGFKVIDDTQGEIGEISKILEMPQQIILEIWKGKKEILIPANENIINKVDKKKKTVYISAPEGLIDLYLDK
jgi:16S rRNA processing protein RimM